MRTKIAKISAGLLSILILLMVPMTAYAEDTSYTYIYDYWGDVQDGPDLYSVCKVFTSSDLKLDVKMKNPQSIYCYHDYIYICDSGNNRIIELKRVGTENMEVLRTIDSFQGGTGPTTFSNPTDIAISEEGEFFIADQGNQRIVKLDKDLNYMMEFVKPVDNTLDPELACQPKKLVIDTAGRVYCIATGINKGLVKYENDGTFSGFIGATPVDFDWTDYVWKKLATQAQRARMESFVPTEYDNLYMDKEGFIYVVTGAPEDADLKTGEADAVRKLNLMGNDILVRNGEWNIIGDLYMGNAGGYDGHSYLADVTVLDNDIYVCLDKNRGRVFGYDDQGNMVFAFGGAGNMDGYFRGPVSIEHSGYDLMILDPLDGAVTLMIPTEYGKLVYQAIDQFDQGDYTASGESWEQVIKYNGNYDLAYIGIGRSLLRQERYREAMDYFELKYDDENYSKAYKQYRKEWVEEHIVVIVIVILALFLVPMTIGKIKAIKHEIDTDEFFTRSN